MSKIVRRWYLKAPRGSGNSYVLLGDVPGHIDELRFASDPRDATPFDSQVSADVAAGNILARDPRLGWVEVVYVVVLEVP